MKIKEVILQSKPDKHWLLDAIVIDEDKQKQLLFKYTSREDMIDDIFEKQITKGELIWNF